jgi:hypothetical protein
MPRLKTLHVGQGKDIYKAVNIPVHIRLWGEIPLSQNKEMKRLLDIGRETKNSNVVHFVIYNLSSYGHKSIPAISEIVASQSDSETRMYGMQTITRIMQGSY